MRKCIDCGQEKELEKFRKRQIWYSHTCKECYAAKNRTGKPNLTRFKKGHIPWIKGKSKEEIKTLKSLRPKSKYRRGEHERERKSESFASVKRAQWGLDIKRRDGFKCQDCGSKNDLHAHHIIPWREDVEQRFKLYNGVTLCRSCHMRIERLLELSQGKNNLKGT